MSGTHIVHDPFYGDEERYDEPVAVSAESPGEYYTPPEVLAVCDPACGMGTFTSQAERRIETMAEKIAFKVKVHPQTDPENPSRLYRIRVFEFHAESWEEALAYAREKGEPLSIALAKVE